MDDCVPEVVLADELTEPAGPEELEELEEASALRSASTLVRAALASFTSPEPRALSNVARSWASGSVVEDALLVLSVVLETGAAELVELVAFVEFGLFAAFASSWNNELCVIVREEIADKLMHFLPKQ